MADNETIADIRKDAETKFRELVEAYIQRRSSFQTTMGAMQAFNNVFDRLEAAHKRESGDCAKLREALMYAEQVLDTAARNVRGETGMVINSAYSEAARKCRAALAAPPRNCEVGTVEEQSARFDKFCDTHKYVGDDGTNWCSRDCPCYNDINCGVRWAQMPYEEGGEK